MRRLLLLTLTVLTLLLPQFAEAQGRGRPKGPQTGAGGSTGSTSTTTTGGAAVGPAAATAFRQFGVWLDDATGPTAGGGHVGIGIGYWRAPGASIVDVPMLDASYGVNSRLQLAASVPFYRSTYQGTTFHGLDDVYLSGKVVAIDAAATRFGLAVSPVLEILSAGYSTDRMHWALPVSVEFRASPVRVYGSAGYFSRGATFGGAALEWSTPAGPIITGAVTQSFSTNDTITGSSGGRADVTFTVAQALTNAVAAYVSVGRTVSSPDDLNRTTLGVAAGLSFTFSPATASP